MRDIYASHDYDPQPCDYCGTVWDTEAQAWECADPVRRPRINVEPLIPCRAYNPDPAGLRRL